MITLPLWMRSLHRHLFLPAGAGDFLDHEVDHKDDDDDEHEEEHTMTTDKRLIEESFPV